MGQCMGVGGKPHQAGSNGSPQAATLTPPKKNSRWMHALSCPAGGCRRAGRHHLPASCCAKSASRRWPGSSCTCSWKSRTGSRWPALMDATTQSGRTTGVACLRASGQAGRALLRAWWGGGGKGGTRGWYGASQGVRRCSAASQLGDAHGVWCSTSSTSRGAASAAVPFMHQLLELGVGQVGAHDVGHPGSGVVRLKLAAVQRHELLQLLG